MKIAWLVNIPLPIVAESMGQTAPVICGWLVQTAELMAEQNDVELAVIFPQNSDKINVDIVIGKIRYISFYEQAIPLLCLLHNKITESCKAKMEKIASPFWRMLQLHQNRLN